MHDGCIGRQRQTNVFVFTVSVSRRCRGESDEYHLTEFGDIYVSSWKTSGSILMVQENHFAKKIPVNALRSSSDFPTIKILPEVK